MPGRAHNEREQTRRLEKLKDHEQDDADDACSQRHHLDGSVDGVFHGAVGFLGHRYKGVTNIISYVRYARAKPHIIEGLTKKIKRSLTFLPDLVFPCACV